MGSQLAAMVAAAAAAGHQTLLSTIDSHRFVGAQDWGQNFYVGWNVFSISG